MTTEPAIPEEDDGQLLDLEWLRDHGFTPRGDQGQFGAEITLLSHSCQDPGYEWESSIKLTLDHTCKHLSINCLTVSTNPTRGSLRRLCHEMGRPLEPKEQPDAD